jgi:hypothetical protein
MDFKTMIVNLTVIGSISAGDKLNTKDKYFQLDHNNLYQGILRFYHREDRNMTINAINALIKNVQEYIDMKKEFEDIEYVIPLITKAITGLEILRTTYELDITFVAEIDLEINYLKKILKSIDVSLKEE